LKRFILKAGPDGDGLVRLSGGDYHYLVHVRRIRPGGSFPALLDGTSCELEALSTDKSILVCGIKGKTAPDTAAFSGRGVPHGPPAALPPIVLFQAMPKGAKIDLIIRQAAESALDEVVVFVSERSVARPGEPEAGLKLERWRRVVREARQQSGSAVDTKLRFCPSLETALSYWTELVRQTEQAAPRPGTAAILLHEAAGLENGAFHGYLDNKPALVALAVGPEGGFSGAETALFREAGFAAVRMGESVLRTETAALSAAAAARIILLERTAWTLKTNKTAP
jgi:16S rRNA (uracil1498-N3)-methyltransferase